MVGLARPGKKQLLLFEDSRAQGILDRTLKSDPSLSSPFAYMYVCMYIYI